MLLLMFMMLCSCDESDNVTLGDKYKPSIELKSNLVGSFSECFTFCRENTSAYIFCDGLLISIIDDVKIAVDGTIYIDEQTSYASIVYFVTAVSDAIDYSSLQLNVTTLADFRAIVSESEQNSRVLTSVYAAIGSTTYNSIDFVRNYSGVNFIVEDSGSTLVSATLNGVYAQFAPFADENPTDISAQFSHMFKGESREFETFYLYKNSYAVAPTISVEVEAANGSKMVYASSFPTQIKNGLSYEVVISSGEITVTEAQWNSESVEEVGPNYQDVITIDVEQSTIPEGAWISPSRDTIYMPYRGASATLKLNVNSGVSLSSESAERVSIESELSDGLMQSIFEIRTGRTNPIGSGESFRLNIQRLPIVNSYDEDFITVTLLENPVEVDDNLKSIVAGEWRFESPDYIDDIISRFCLPTGYELKTEGDWLRSSTDSEGYTVIEAAYKPNDADGDGRLQEGALVITDSDGVEDRYELARRNWSMPVVWINGRHWARFNQRGDAESYSDQVRVGSTLDQIDDLYSYIKSASAQQYLEYVGDQYISQQVGKPLTFSAESQIFTDYDSATIGNHIAIADKGVGCPPGFERPSMDEILYILLDGANYGTASDSGDSTSQFNTSVGSYRNQCTSFRRRNVAVSGDVTTTIFSTQIENIQSGTSFDKFLFSGFGSQSSATIYDAETTILGIYYPGSIWTMKAICSSNYNISQSGQYVTTSYTLRCIKKEVPFTIE